MNNTLLDKQAITFLVVGSIAAVLFSFFLAMRTTEVKSTTRTLIPIPATLLYSPNR